MLSLYIAGLKKQTGKTVVAAGLACTMQSLSYATSYFKTIQTGAEFINGKLQSQDILLMNKFDSNIKCASSYVLESALPPLVSAYESDVKKIDIQKISNDYRACIQMTDCHIIEGSNSVSTPVDEKKTEIDLINTLHEPVILVVNPKKSSLDDVILGMNYINQNKTNLLGVIVNDYDKDSSNLEEKYYPHLIKEYTDAKLLGFFPHYENFDNIGADILISDTLNNLNIEDIFGIEIAKLR